MNGQSKKPITVYILTFFVFFLAISGLIGGFSLVISSDGALSQMPLSMLEGSPFTSYLIPGLILLIILGIFPSLVTIGLIWKYNWKIFNFLNIYKDHHWSWICSVYSGIVLIIWIDFQIMFIGYGHYIQFIYALLGVIIVILSLIPSVNKYYLV